MNHLADQIDGGLSRCTERAVCNVSRSYTRASLQVRLGRKSRTQIERENKLIIAVFSASASASLLFTIYSASAHTRISSLISYEGYLIAREAADSRRVARGRFSHIHLQNWMPSG
jgi:hypothetical protein|eukprot:SAG25_NODE_636_length_6268_cov_2.205997_4_plen_115_part_00